MTEGSGHLNVAVTGDGIIIAELADRKVLDEMSISQIGDQLSAMVVESESPKLVLDFSAVSQMSSSALGMLITVHKRIREKRGQLRLCGIQPSIYEVFVITRINEILQICPTRQEAIDSLT